MRNFLLVALLGLVFSGARSQVKLLSPAEFLGYELGDRFTRHHRVIEYFRHVESAATNVKVSQYGETYEHRPLLYAVVASAENFAKLEQIRTDNLRRASVLEGAPS